MTTYADKTTLLRALTGLHERTLDDPITQQLFGGAILIREITARQRQDANDAALAQDADTPDNSLYRAMLIQQSVVDPESGMPYADGRAGIDPRTRRSLFTIHEVSLIAEGRDIPMTRLVEAISSLAALGPQAMFSGDPTADGSERDAGASDPVVGDTAAQDTVEGVGAVDGGNALPGEPLETVDATAG